MTNDLALEKELTNNMMIQSLFQKIIIILSLEYLLFFSAEVVLPGVITSVFNINILLLGILFLIGVLVLMKSRLGYEANQRINIKLYNKIISLLIVFLLVVNMIALYKLSVAMVLVHIIIVVAVVKLLWNNQ